MWRGGVLLFGINKRIEGINSVLGSRSDRSDRSERSDLRGPCPYLSHAPPAFFRVHPWLCDNISSSLTNDHERTVMKKSLFLFLTLSLLLFCSLSLHADKEMTFLSTDEFIIIPWGHVPDDVEAIQAIRDCGFNIAGLSSAENLDKLHAAGLKALYFDSRIHARGDQVNLAPGEIRERVEEAVAKVSEHPALYGYYVCDEPGADDYPGLARWHEAFQKADPDKLAYINLFPNYASPQQMNVPTYEEYVESYITTVAPTIVSYDHYALMEGGTLRDSYFNNLEVIRAASQRHELPFWNIVLSNAHFTYAEPSPAGFRFQLYTTLAYGAKGICYFTYFTPEVGNYRL